MIHEDIQLTGSFQASGSFTLPNHATSESITNPTTGSTYNDTTDNVVKLYNGTEWVVVGEQTASAVGTDLEYLLVAGGGGGGRYGGGGGAGGYLSSSLSSIESGSSFSVTVGGGGAGHVGDAQSGGTGTVGTDSSIAEVSITTITSYGGGGGGNYSNPGGSESDGDDGGSGGGGGRTNSSGNAAGGDGTVGQGNDGGGSSNNYSNHNGGGGGGAGADGASGVNGGSNGSGGNGKASSITGTSVTYAGGGGGSHQTSGTVSGGTGGGGTGYGPSATATTDADGDTNTGGGGGGTSDNNIGGTIRAGNGGSGVAIFAYDTGSASGLGGTKTLNGGRMVHTFNSSGTLTIAGAGEYPVANASVFNTVLYTGNSNTQAITNVGFQPDMVWIKPRNPGDNHNIFDSIRGVTKQIITNNTSAESTQSNTLQSFDSNGFTTGPDNNTNLNNTTYVAWTWKAGGAASLNENGSIDSQVSANQDAGFSIVTWTGNGIDATVGTGLSSQAELVITKGRANLATYNQWVTYHKDLSTNHHLYLNTTDAEVDGNGNYFRDAAFTDSVIGLGDDIYGSNVNGTTMVAYCFHSVDGYQKIGSYSGSNSPITITTGFQPRFVLIKRTNTAGNSWVIIDSARGDGSNANALFPDLSAAESSGWNTDFISTGFTISSNESYVSAAGGEYIYLAIG